MEVKYTLGMADNNKGTVPMIWACKQGHLETLKLLVGVNWHKVRDTRSSNGSNLLHIASLEGHVDIASFLIDGGINVNDQECGYTALHAACENGHLEVVRLLVKMGANMAATRKDDDCTALYLASYNGHLDVVKYLTERDGVDIEQGSREFSPLHGACQQGHLKVVQYLVGKGARPHLASKNGSTPLYVASFRGFLEIVKYLVGLGVDVKQRYNGYTPLHIACQEGHLNIIQYFVDGVGADLKYMTRDGSTPLYLAAFHGHLSVLKFLIGRVKGTSIDQMVRGFTALHGACQNGHLDIVRYLLDVGADMSKTISCGCSTLYVAALNDRLEIVKLLIHKGAKPDSGHARTALHVACEKGNLEIVKLLTNNGADLNKTSTNDSSSPLIQAITEKHFDVVRYLLSKRVDLDKTSQGWTAIHIACQIGDIEIIRVLADAGANLESKMRDGGTTPLYLASLNGNLEAVRFLTGMGVAVGKTNQTESAFHIACQKGYLDIVKHLASKGADINEETTSGFTPLDLASCHGRTDVVEFLISLDTNDGNDNTTVSDEQNRTGNASTASLAARQIEIGAISAVSLTPHTTKNIQGTIEPDIESQVVISEESNVETTRTSSRDMLPLEESNKPDRHTPSYDGSLHEATLDHSKSVQDLSTSPRGRPIVDHEQECVSVNPSQEILATHCGQAMTTHVVGGVLVDASKETRGRLMTDHEFEGLLLVLSKEILDEQLSELGHELAFSLAEIRRFKQTNMKGPEITTDGTLSMLDKWHQRTPVMERRERLGKALVDANLLRLADKYSLLPC